MKPKKDLNKKTVSMNKTKKQRYVRCPECLNISKLGIKRCPACHGIDFMEIPNDTV